MPAPLAVDREAVRVLVVAVGVREAARQVGLDEDTVKSWSRRGGWLAGKAQIASAIMGAPTPARNALASTLPVSMRPVHPAPDAPTPGEAMANSLENLSKRGRYAYLAAGVAVGEAMASRAARLVESNPDAPEAILDALLPEGQNAKAWAGTTALAGSWEAKQPVAQVMVSVQMLGMRPEELRIEGSDVTVLDSTGE